MRCFLGRPSEEEIGLDGAGVFWAPWWALPWDDYHMLPLRATQDAADVGDLLPHAPPVAHAFVAWRDYATVLLMQRAASRRLVWLHDTYQPDMAGSAAMEDATDAYLVLSEEHSRQLPARIRHKAVVTRNGVPATFFEARRALAAAERNRAHRFVYASMPSRGLTHVLQAWPTIHACMSQAGLNASLHVYYGFTQHDEQRAANDREYRAWMESMRAALGRATSLGIHYMGMRSHSHLAQAMAESGFYLYPTAYPETSCIALMQAQAAGAIPITSRYQWSALPETAGLFDLGPSPIPLDPATSQGIVNHEWLVKWANRVCYVAGAFGGDAADAVVHRVRRDRGAPETPKVTLAQHREEMVEWARRNLDWYV